ncbi:unnamed protein product [Plasmodium vivax]|uniref:(malaria parasite P. vivax) hypothetical protein n=1 Tax=Plasmodium vivax TaxID=5855 RepID=A0A8S4H895_PLAVI|nr:unnamed protein product [Plasmodium vivax]
MEKTEAGTHKGAEKWRKGGMSIITNMIHNAKNLFPKNNLHYTYVNTFLLCLFFTFIHKYLDQTLPSLYKSIENDFNIDVKTLYYVNTMYKLAYSAFNFFFALFFDYSFKRIFFVKYEKACAGGSVGVSGGSSGNASGSAHGERGDRVKKDGAGDVGSGVDGGLSRSVSAGVSDTHYEIQFNGEQEGGVSSGLNNSVSSNAKATAGGATTGGATTSGDKPKHNSAYISDEVILGEYRYTLKILVVSSIVYVVVIFGIMLSNNFLYFFLFMFIMGINNSCIYILIQKIYTNNVFSENRSTIFGFLHFFSSISHMLSISINTNLSNKFYWGVNGWRICYFVISFLPIIVCIYLLGLIKQRKFKRSKSKNNSFSYLVSFDNMTDVCQESEKEESSCQGGGGDQLESSCRGGGSDQLEGLPSASKAKREEKKKKKKKKEEEEILLFNAEQEERRMGDRHPPLGASKSYDSSYALHREGVANVSKTSDGTAYLNNSSKMGVRHSASTNDDFNTVSFLSTSERIGSNLIKRSLSHMASRSGARNVGANGSSSGGSEASGGGNYPKQGKGKHHTKGTKKKKNSLEEDANQPAGKGTNTNNSPIFAKRNEERERYEHRDELDNLLEEDEKEKEKKLKYEFSYLYEIKYVFKNYSFWLMITMGMLNGIPKHVLSLMIYFFQYCNISDFRSGLIISLSWLCASLISPFIGIISDYIYRLNKDINRQRIGMCTHCLRIILMFTMFFFVPKEAESFIYFVIISLFMGILSGWINIGTHKPIIIDIVKQRHTAFVMALMSAFENIGSSIIGTFFLSFLLNRYNYIDKRKVSTADVNVNRHNVHVLSDVLLILTCFPWLISFCLLYVLKFTYKKDKLYNNLF